MPVPSLIWLIPEFKFSAPVNNVSAPFSISPKLFGTSSNLFDNVAIISLSTLV